MSAALLALALVAGKKPAPTVTVEWVTQLAAGHTHASNAGDVTWPQTLLSSDAPCGVVVQADVYRYGDADKAAVDALVGHGVLNRPGSAEWTDTAFLVSYSFTLEPACPTESPSPTPTDPVPSATPTPTTSPTPTPTSPAVRSPSPSVSTKKTFTPSLSATPLAQPTLPMTGDPLLAIAAVGSLLLGAGAGSIVFSRRKPPTHR